MPATAHPIPPAALAVVAAGVSAALHLGKLSPAMPALQASLNLGLMAAGFLLSLVQLAGMIFGLGVGLTADLAGLRRSVLTGLCLLALASALGGLVGLSHPPQAVTLLLWLRALEGIGFLLVAMPAPALIRALTPPAAEKKAFGLWGAYVPLGVALALLLGPPVIAHVGWPSWWLLAAALSAMAAMGVAALVPADATRPRPAPTPWRGRLTLTLRSREPWLVALAFAVYSSQWIAVIGFLPSIYARAGIDAGWSALLTALAAAMNIAGSLGGGQLLQRGVTPIHLLCFGYIAMAIGSFIAFADIAGDSATLRYLAVCLFSLSGGVVPATFFLLAVRLAPSPATASTTVGLVQQANAMGQFLGPPVVAWVARQAGGWHWTWAVTLPCSLAGILLATGLAKSRARAD